MSGGRFIALEGGEGVGKSTAITGLVDYLQGRGIDVVQTREPGGTPIAEIIRDLVLTPRDEPLAVTAELLLMFAARAQNLERTIRPALARGDWVVCDRFTDATLAYQGYGRGGDLQQIYTLADLVHGGLWPDRTLWLDADQAVANRRRSGRRLDDDRFEREQQAFFERVRNGYAELSRKHAGRYRRIDANGSRASVVEQLAAAVSDLID